MTWRRVVFGLGPGSAGGLPPSRVGGADPATIDAADPTPGLAAALAVWIVGPRRFRGSILTWLDAVGMAAYAVVGALKATSLGVPPFSAVVMGVLTATFGGVIRDVLAHEPSVGP